MFDSVGNNYVDKIKWGWEIDPIGLRIALRQVYEKYQLPIIIAENGLDAKDIVRDGKINDQYRANYLADHIMAMKEAISDGVDLIGYCAWSFTDLLSWLNGYSKCYGLVYIDQDDTQNGTLRRVPRKSYSWYQQIILINGNKLSLLKHGE